MIPQRGLKGEHLKADGALMSHVDLRGDLFLEGMIVRVAKYIIIICRWQANNKQSNRKGSIRRTESLPNSKSPTLQVECIDSLARFFKSDKASDDGGIDAVKLYGPSSKHRLHRPNRSGK
jgi:hypothetical protein